MKTKYKKIFNIGIGGLILVLLISCEKNYTVFDNSNSGVLCSGCGPSGADLIVATADEGSADWANSPCATTDTRANYVSNGSLNLEIFEDLGISYFPAANLCYRKGDGWYLPSKYELNNLYTNKTAIGGFSDDYYWSSTEYDSNSAWSQYFSNGNQDSYGKSNSDRVRCVRRAN